ncbi:hypothetical protein [Undibacterium terreum]|uniref:Uncharacterized protein n=1 Tax=Undibacterium terreum TaxID=1224302 RepID=A0A916UJE7_9BURK|nr:hypothetical protein [Undibacterium terreum]GGC74292.1 hypothetical protein GCM10011396_21850 [Undibacterium terreum]
MALFFVEAVKFDGSGERVEKVRWGKSKGGEITPPAFVADPEDADVSKVVEAIENGDEVITKFHVKDSIVMGPLIKVVTNDDGTPGITTAAYEQPGFELNNLPTF